MTDGPDYPFTRRSDVAEEVHGYVVADPYRWLEDPDDPETVDWVDRQRAFTEEWFRRIPERAWFRSLMRSAVARPRVGVPLHKAGWYLVSRNDGTAAQDVLHVASSLPELLQGGRVLLDPNGWSEDGTASLSSFGISPDGRTLAYGVSRGGSDWQEVRVVRMTDGTPVDDAQIATKFCAPTWLPDSASWCYLAYPEAGRAEGTETKASVAAHLMVHRLGTPVSEDLDLLSFPEDPRISAWPQLSDDHRWLIVTISRGTDHETRLWLSPLSTSGGITRIGEPLKVVDNFTALYQPLGVADDTLFVLTDEDAPLGRVIALDLSGQGRAGREADDTGRDVGGTVGRPGWRTVVPMGQHTIEAAALARTAVIVETLVDAQPRLRRFAHNGTDLGLIPVEGGAVVAINAEPACDGVFVGMSSLTVPTTSWRLDAATGELAPLPLLPDHEGDGALPRLVSTRGAATSRDGTGVPFTLIAADRVDRNLPQPTLMYGYGGFNLPVLADYRPGWSAWLAAGGVLVLTNLRGGSEFGTPWYDAGRLGHKQNVFDDFIAIAEHLIATNVTTRQQLAIYGRSNGGLLVGAVMTQRPELFAAAIPQVGVLDLLRFHLFTIGSAWTSDYGNPEHANDFELELAYSPLHNILPETCYPPTLVLTGDHDDRVVPAHSYKFVATLQDAQSGDNPVLARIERATGHGVGKPLEMVADEWADLLAFAAHFTGLRPPDHPPTSGK